jgi:DNA-binding MarR family transcriptional regulator
MLIFAHLRSLTAFRERHLPFLRSLEDEDMVREIGHYQVLGAPLTLKQLLVIRGGSVATVQRRLQRLKRLGVVQDRRSESDRRSVELRLSPACMKAFSHHATLLAEGLADSGQAQHSCALCDGEAGCREMAVRFLKEGLRQKQRCLLVGSPGFRDATLAELEGSARKRDLAGQLVHFGGARSAASMLEFLEGVFKEARAAGTTVRLMGNMSWAHTKMNFDTLMDFEARLDPLLRRFRGQALCQYDVRRFRGPQLLSALKCHADTNRYPVMLS